MRLVISFFALGLVAVSGLPEQARIVGGSTTTIGRYPFMAALLRNNGNSFRQMCCGTILNHISILTAAHCVFLDSATRWRFRVGSASAHSGGRTVNVMSFRLHPSYRPPSFNADIAILRGTTTISFTSNIQPVRYAGSSHTLNAGTTVWAVGWGATRFQGANSETLRHVQLTIANQQNCIRNYAARGISVNGNMVCANAQGRDQCSGDSGGPLLHNGVQVGISSFGRQCALPNYPGVNTRVNQFSSWITQNFFR